MTDTPGAPAPAARSLGTRSDLAAAAAIAVVATLLPFHRGLGFPFALDDYSFLLQAAGIDPAPFSIRRWLAVRGYYSLWLQLFGPNPLAWHVTSFALHAANAVWVYAFARRLGASLAGAWVACGLFAASPLAFTVLYWAACIQEIGSTFFLFTAVWFVWRTGRWRWMSLLPFALAMLCKESVIAAPLVLPLLLGRRAFGPAVAMLVTGAVIFLGSGLHARMFDSNLESPYATAYDWTLVAHLASQVVWFVAPWRAYPDRLAVPDRSLVLPAAGVVASVAAALALGRGRQARPLLVAAAWYVALLLPVLPLRQHAYAYYSYAPQAGFLILAGEGVLRIAARLAPLSWWLRFGAGTAAVTATILLAARNTRTHETLTLPNSTVPHDSIVRYGYASGSLVAAVREAQRQPDLRRVVFMSLPEELGVATQTPGQVLPGMLRVRKLTIREALRGGRLVPLHAPGVTGVWEDTLTSEIEEPGTVIYFASGFNSLQRVPGPRDAYIIQAQWRLLGNDVDGARRDLERTMALTPDFTPARVLLAGVEAKAGNEARARELLAGLETEELPPEIREFHAQLVKALAVVTGH